MFLMAYHYQQTLSFRYDNGLQCTDADCGTGRIWNEKVKCDVNSANMLDCLAEAKPTFPKDHSKDTIARCKGKKDHLRMFCVNATADITVLRNQNNNLCHQETYLVTL